MKKLAWSALVVVAGVILSTSAEARRLPPLRVDSAPQLAAIAREATARAGLATRAKVDFARKSSSSPNAALARREIARYAEETVWFSPRFDLAAEPYRTIGMQASRKFGFEAVATFFLAHEFCHASLYQAAQDGFENAPVDPRTKDTLRFLDDCDNDAIEEIFCDAVAVATLEALRRQGDTSVPTVREAAAYIKTAAFKFARKLAPNDVELARRIYHAEAVAVANLDRETEPQEAARIAVKPFCAAPAEASAVSVPASAHAPSQATAARE